MDSRIAKALEGLNERDPDKMASAVAARLHGLPANYDDSPLTFSDTTIRHGKLFVDSWVDNTVVLVWALPKGARWVKAAGIQLILGRGPTGGYSAATLVSSNSGQVFNRTGPCERTGLAEAVDAALCVLLTEPHLMIRPITGPTPGDNGFRAVKKWGIILMNLAVFAWLLLPAYRFFSNYEDWEARRRMFMWWDPLLLLGIFVIGLGTILLSRRRYLDSIHTVARVGLLEGLTSTRRGNREEQRAMTPDYLEPLERETFDTGWWLCMFAGLILPVLLFDLLAPLVY